MIKIVIAENMREGFRWATEENISRGELCILLSGYGNTWYRIRGLRFKPEDVVVLSYVPPELMRLIEEGLKLSSL